MAVGFPIQAEVIACPGANKVTHVPKLEKVARASTRTEFLSANVVAPTVIAVASDAGEY